VFIKCRGIKKQKIYCASTGALLQTEQLNNSCAKVDVLNGVKKVDILRRLWINEAGYEGAVPLKKQGIQRGQTY